MCYAHAGCRPRCCSWSAGCRCTWARPWRSGCSPRSTRPRWSGSPLGVVFALTAAALWAGYILLSQRVVSAGLGVDGVAVGFAVAAVVLSPLALGTGPVWGSPRLLVLGIGVGVLSTVLPYALDQVVLRR